MDQFIANFSGRLDVFLSQTLQISRNQVANLIKNSSIKVNESVVDKASFKLSGGELVEINYPEIEQISYEDKIDFDVEILYEDDDILVLNKPANLVVHPAPSVKEATLVEWLKSKNYMLSTINGEIRAGIVHRLDKGTSGAIIVAKNNFAHSELSKQLSNKSMGRIYLAFIDLALKEDLIIDRAIGRNPNNRLKKAIISAKNGGRAAKSAFRNIANDENFNLIAAKLFTGRTHQIRVHLSSISRHILGDFLYGFKSENDRICRVMLHAYLLYFAHPRSGKMIMISANLPHTFKNLIDKSNLKDRIYEEILPNTLYSSFNGADSWMYID